MSLSKLISRSKDFKNFIFFFLMFFFINNLLVAKADEDKYIIINNQEENKLKEFYSQNTITFSNHDKLESQLKMFLGLDPENPDTSYYPDLLLIKDSDYVRDMYNLKLNEMTIKK